MDSSSGGFCWRHSGLEGRQFLPRPISCLDSLGIAARGLRPQPSDRPHDQTSSPHDFRSRFPPDGRAPKSSLLRNVALPTKPLCPRILPSTRTMVCKNSHKTCGLLDRFCVDPRCMAYPCTVYTVRRVCDLAHARASNVFWRRTLVLVACYSALAKHLNWAAMVDAVVPVSGNSAVRHPLWISCFL